MSLNFFFIILCSGKFCAFSVFLHCCKPWNIVPFWRWGGSFFLNVLSSALEMWYTFINSPESIHRCFLYFKHLQSGSTPIWRTRKFYSCNFQPLVRAFCLLKQLMKCYSKKLNYHSISITLYGMNCADPAVNHDQILKRIQSWEP